MTTQDWISANDPPSVQADGISDPILVTDTIRILIGRYRKRLRNGPWVLVMPRGNFARTTKLGVTITHWMPLPEISMQDWKSINDSPSVNKNMLSDHLLVINGSRFFIGYYRNWLTYEPWVLDAVFPIGSYERVSRLNIALTHWMPLPEMPSINLKEQT